MKYRRLALDSWHCIFHTVTFRKCESGLDERIKAGITGRMMRFWPFGARTVYKHYQIFTWIVLALLLWSTYYTAVGGYNLIKYGNCNGPENPGICILNPATYGSGITELDTATSQNITQPRVDKHNPVLGEKNASLTIIEFGCYACPYTKAAEPTVKQVLEEYSGRVNLQFKHVIIPRDENSALSAEAVACASEQGRYSEYRDLLFKNPEGITREMLGLFAVESGIDKKLFDSCLDGGKYANTVQDDNTEAANAGIKGTPTFYIRTSEIVGPKPIATFRAVIDDELNRCSGKQTSIFSKTWRNIAGWFA